MTLADLTQRLGRADLLDGIGVYVGPDRLALAQLRKRLLRVELGDVEVHPLPPPAQAAERRDVVTAALRAFARTHASGARRAYIVLPRRMAVMTRVLLPAAARENLAQVLEYEIDTLVPLPKDEVHYDFVVRGQDAERVDVLLTCLPRTVVQEHRDLLDAAGLRVRGIGLSSTALADYVYFCRGGESEPIALLVGEGDDVEVALVRGGRLAASQLVPTRRLATGDLDRALARELADEQLEVEQVAMVGIGLPGELAGAVTLGPDELVGIAGERLEGGGERLRGLHPAALIGVGGALAAVREQTVPLNLLPADERRAADEGTSLATMALAGLVAVLLLVWGVSAMVKQRLLLRTVQQQVAVMQPKVREVHALQDEIGHLQKQLDILSSGEDVRATRVLADLTELIPTDGYLTTLTLRQGRITMDGQAAAASEIITALEKSKRFRNVTFSSPTTRAGDKERFALIAEVTR